ncbi:hypothetical protein J2Y02_001117 [Neobacillus drentensis]|nr:hypothetical protein [Neobacillus drentensis]
MAIRSPTSLRSETKIKSSEMIHAFVKKAKNIKNAVGKNIN